MLWAGFSVLARWAFRLKICQILLLELKVPVSALTLKCPVILVRTHLFSEPWFPLCFKGATPAPYAWSEPGIGQVLSGCRRHCYFVRGHLLEGLGCLSLGQSGPWPPASA